MALWHTASKITAARWSLPFGRGCIAAGYTLYEDRTSIQISTQSEPLDTCKTPKNVCPVMFAEQVRIVTNELRTYGSTYSNNHVHDVHFTWCGEALANKYIVHEWQRVHEAICARLPGSQIRFNVWTTMPNSIRRKPLAGIFGDKPVQIHYTVANDNARTMHIHDALDMLLEYEGTNSFNTAFYGLPAAYLCGRNFRSFSE
jgi:hypothetical protein